MQRTGLVGASQVLFIAGTLLLLAASAALASNWVSTDNAYKAGDANVHFHRCALATNTRDAFNANDSHDIEPTDITTSLFTRCGNEDVRINDYGYGLDDPRGFYECHEFHSSQNCDKGHAHINTSYSSVPESYNETLEVVCEEIGHSVGLAHSPFDSSCMSGNVNARHLDGHDKNVIDAHYP